MAETAPAEPTGARQPLPELPSRVDITLTVNGHPYTRSVEPRLLLVDLLRNELGLTGTHIGCDTTTCGACTVHLDGRSVKSCTLFAVQADSRAVRTAEGLATPGKPPVPLMGKGGRPLPGVNGEGVLHPLQQAFHEAHALQCGYCTPGMIMSALYLLERHPRPSREQIKRAIAGNLCRCTGYEFIVEAIALAAERLAAGEARPAAGEPRERT
jgi:carbon-monoxide dehydrogenase small subunit